MPPRTATQLPIPPTPEKEGMPIVVKLIMSAVGLIVLMIGIWIINPFFSVSEYERTVVTRFGQFSYVAGPGLHLRLPIVNSMETYAVNMQSFHENKINTYTIDNQELDAQITVVYQLPESNIQRIFTEVRDYKPRLASLAIDRFKREMGKINVADVAAKRGTIAATVRDLIKHDAQELYGIQVVDFQINDLEFTKSYRAAIDAAATAKARVEQAEQEKRQAEVEAQRKKIQAEGEANAVREQARGRADGALLEATAQAKGRELIGLAEAKALEAQAAALQKNQTLVSMEMAKRWSGNLPTNMYGSAPIPFLQMMMEQQK